MVRRLTGEAQRSGADTANLKTIVYGGGPMYLEDLKAAMETFGPKLAQIYGQGERIGRPRRACPRRWSRCAWPTIRATRCRRVASGKCWYAAMWS